ncbi:MAG: serine hydrolase domain-containing protein [Gemmatimonadaceae bacterium]
MRRAQRIVVRPVARTGAGSRGSRRLALRRVHVRQTERATLRMIARQNQLNFATGTDHLYSNSGYVLLAMVVHRVSGRTLDEWAREHVFAPLTMSNTRYQHDHARLIPERAVGYVRQDTTWRLGISMLDVVGDGGLYSTLDDMLRWAANFDSGKVAPNQLARMQTPGTLKNGNAIGNGYGMGLVRGSYRGLETIGHGGALVGYRTAFLRLPAEKTTVVCLCNAATANPGRLAQRVADLYVGHAMAAAVVAPNASAPGSQLPTDAAVPADLRKALVGTFHSAELDAVYVVRNEGERLLVEAGDRPAVTLVAGGPDRLRLERSGVVMVLDRGADGEVKGFTLEAGRVRGLRFTRR